MSALSARLVLLAIVASLVLAAPAWANQIAYNCGYDICLINPDNPEEHSNLTETTAGVGDEQFPAWSPDGSRIAFRGLYDITGFDHWNVYTLNPLEAAPRTAINVSQSSDRDAQYSSPQWSPDGTRLAWNSIAASSADPVQDGIYVGAAAGTSLPVQVGTNREGSYPTWSADGTRIAFGSSPEGVYGTAADGSGTATFIPNGLGLQPTFSPDGKWIASNRWNGYPYHVRVFAADGSGGHDLAKISDLGTKIGWSYDSTRVVYVADEEPSLDQVWVAPADGSSPGVQIPMPTGWIVPHNPSFSPDGTRVAFSARPNTGPGYEQILIAPADGSAAAVPITKSAQQNEQPAWKPGPGLAPKPPAGPAPPASQAPVKIKLAFFKRPIIVGDHMLAVGIDCHAPGGHPTGWVAEFCAASANAYPTGVAPAGLRPWAKPKAKAKKLPLFAKGSVRVPEGKTKTLKMKLTRAGKKLLKPGKTIKLTLSVTVKRSGGGKPTKSTRTITLKVPPKKAKQR